MKIILTGASRGIGAATIKELAKNGNQDILAIARNEERLAKLKAETEATFPGSKVHLLVADLSKIDEKTLRAKIEATIGGVDLLINNAGYLINKPFSETSLEDWRQVFEINVFAVAFLTKTLLPYLQQSGNAHVLNISSMGGFQGSSKFPGLSAYSSSKAALANLTECLAEELQDFNIKVNCLAIGAVQTEMLAQAFPGYKAPLEAEEMASFFAYFALQGHRFFNGKVLPVSVSTP